MSASGDLFCLQTLDGTPLWQKSYPKDFLSQRPVWGFCDYPLVDGEKVICSPVGPGATVTALNKRIGEMVWKTEVPGEQAGYAAAVVSEAGGIRQYVVFLSRSLLGIGAGDGKVLWRYARPNTRVASSYTPIVQGDLVFSPNGYGGGIALIGTVRAFPSWAPGAGV